VTPRFQPHELVMTLADKRTLVVHGSAACSGDACCIHAPSAHPLDAAPMLWRRDRQLMERVCEHGIGHPDRDHIAYVRRAYGLDVARVQGVHGCDGCCFGEPLPAGAGR
jgi:UDP-2,3-diacylglucosamine pyrophosphatase LpxH